MATRPAPPSKTQISSDLETAEDSDILFELFPVEKGNILSLTFSLPPPVVEIRHFPPFVS